ncbi:MAG: hypothetical protein R3A46_03720 [Thermomicrobiales bacterium]
MQERALLLLLHSGRFTWDEFLITFVITFGLAGFVWALTRLRGDVDYDPEDDPNVSQPDEP